MSAKVSFRITTYWKRPRGEAGLTQMASRRLSAGEALDWVLDELPDDAVTVTSDVSDGNDRVTITVNWLKVPAEIRDGRP